LPLYEYKCKKCGRVTEKIRKFSDPPLTVCESCRGKLEQLISSPAIQFKGSGWYVTDYAKKSSVPSNSSEGSSSSSEKSEGSSSSSENSEKKESKAAKSEGKSEAKESKKASEPAKASSKKD